MVSFDSRASEGLNPLESNDTTRRAIFRSGHNLVESVDSGNLLWRSRAAEHDDFVDSAVERGRVGGGVVPEGALDVLVGDLRSAVPLKRERYRCGPTVASWPKILTANPYERPQVGPTFGPTL